MMLITNKSYSDLKDSLMKTVRYLLQLKELIFVINKNILACLFTNYIIEFDN